MFWLVVGLHVICCLILILVVLMQSGKAADLAGAFGGMGTQTAFGPRSAANVLTRVTTIAAGLFMITSLTLSLMWTKRSGGGSILDQAPKVSTPAPAKPADPSVPLPQPVIPGQPVAPTPAK
jgi:preprotein translocase subunit SecG